MMRTVKLKLRCDEAQRNSLLRTMEAYTFAFNASATWGFNNKTSDRYKNHFGTYRSIRERVPTLSSTLVQSARDCACWALKSSKLKKKPVRKKRAAMRYKKKSIRICLAHGFASISTVDGRIRCEFSYPEYYQKYSDWEIKTSSVSYRKESGDFYLGVVMEGLSECQMMEGPVLGIDRGLNNVAVASDGRFFNSKKLKGIRGRHAHNRASLQAKGTRSAKRRLRKMSGRERWFVTCMNHEISKQLVNGPHTLFVLEDLKGIGSKRKMSGRMPTKLALWPYYEFEQQLKYKAEGLGKKVIKISPYNTSRRCSKCGYIDPENRKGTEFKCLCCGNQLNADLNAARNIAFAGKSGLGRLPVNQPNASRRDSQTLKWDSGSDERRCEFFIVRTRSSCTSATIADEEQLTLTGVEGHPPTIGGSMA